MIIKSARIVNDNFEFEQLDITIKDGKISRIGQSTSTENEKVLCYEGCTIVPGFIDIHNHGHNGYSVMDANLKSLNEISKSLAKRGVTTYLPTTITDTYENLAIQCGNIAKYKNKVIGTKIAGINLEGPFISKEKLGVHNVNHIKNPDICKFNELVAAANGYVKIVTVAPELTCALDFIKQASVKTLVSLGHSSATYEQTLLAFNAGAKSVTHFGNACSGFNQRDPGMVGATFNALPKNSYIELICDGVHLHPAFVSTCFKFLDISQIVLVSDSTKLAGLPDGEYYEFGNEVIVKNNSAKLKNGTLSGSVTDVYSSFKYIMLLGISFLDALKTVTINPAKSISMNNEIGSLMVGKFADLVVLDDVNNIVEVFIQGNLT